VPSLQEEETEENVVRRWWGGGGSASPARWGACATVRLCTGQGNWCANQGAWFFGQSCFFHRITERLGLAGTSVGHPSQPPAEAGSPRAGCTAPRPGGSWISPEKETPQPL